MGKYGNIPFGKACMQEKELIIHALKGELESGMAEDYKPVYNKAPAEECEKAVIAAYDEVVFQAQSALASGRAMERLFEEVTGTPASKYMHRYIELMQEEVLKAKDYTYETSKEEEFV